jgi:hypothetical protein
VDVVVVGSSAGGAVVVGPSLDGGVGAVVVVVGSSGSAGVVGRVHEQADTANEAAARTTPARANGLVFTM